MALAKLMIVTETGQTIVALFNPNQFTLNKTVNWQSVPIAESDVPRSQFTHGDPTTLDLDLFFDTYEQETDVRRYTSQIAGLTTVAGHGRIHRPPICSLSWGLSGIFFEGVLERLTQRFTLFLPTGLPVRATLSCGFKEWIPSETEARLQNKQSVDVAKTRVVKRGDTLSSIAAEEYLDPEQWRPIARANKLSNPRKLTPGQILSIPVLRTP